MDTSNSSTRTHHFRAPTKIVFSVNSIEKVAAEAKRLNGKKICLISDEVITKLGIVDKVRKQLEEKHYVTDVFDEVKPEPSLANAEAIAEYVREKNCNLIVGIGGGSVMDVAKIASAMARNQGKVSDYVAAGTFKKHGLPKILIPTTAGTGSEVSQAAVVTLKDKRKASFSDPHLFADVAIVDPTLTMTMPKEITATTGIDALSHAVEAMMSSDSNPIIDALSLEAVKLIKDNLKLAYDQGDNLNARIKMSWAAVLGGMVIYAKAVYGHSFSYTIGPKYDFSHGLSCALALPYVMDYNLPACVDKFLSIAASMREHVENVSRLDDAFKAVVAVKKLIEDVKLPSSLREAGVPKKDLQVLAEELITFYPRQNNPRMITKEDAIKLYERAWEGRIGDKP